MPKSRAILVVDLAYGDCGKGTIVDFLTRTHNAHTVVRFNGGPQAGHNVITPDGRHHTFSQFGSGMFVPNVRTVLSRFMLIEPYALLNEAAHLAQLGVRNALDRLLIDRRCVVITPPEQAANRLRELARGEHAHGTCGLGIGETMQDSIELASLVLRAGELADGNTVARKLRQIQELKREQLRSEIDSLGGDPRATDDVQTLLDDSWIDIAVGNYQELSSHVTICDGRLINRLLIADGVTIFEGAQGVLLDETFGFHPHTTWSNTTFANADTLLDETAFQGQRQRIGVLRTYFTRHGPGPFVTDDPTMRDELPEAHNNDAGAQGRFRVGAFDAVSAQYAISVCGGGDGLALTHLDRLPNLPPRICTAYESDTADGSMGDAFVHDGKVITAIRHTLPTSLDRLAERTRVIARCRPVYEEMGNAGSGAFIETLTGVLKKRVSITSFGPTAADKRLISNGV